MAVHTTTTMYDVLAGRYQAVPFSIIGRAQQEVTNRSFVIRIEAYLRRVSAFNERARTFPVGMSQFIKDQRNDQAMDTDLWLVTRRDACTAQADDLDDWLVANPGVEPSRGQLNQMLRNAAGFLAIMQA